MPINKEKEILISKVEGLMQGSGKRKGINILYLIIKFQILLNLVYEAENKYVNF